MPGAQSPVSEDELIRLALRAGRVALILRLSNAVTSDPIEVLWVKPDTATSTSTRRVNFYISSQTVYVLPVPPTKSLRVCIPSGVPFGCRTLQYVN